MNSVYVLLALILTVILARYLYLRFFNAHRFFNAQVSGFENADTFVLYYADWCPHCKTVKPIFAEWAKNGSVNIGGKTVFCSMVEADANPEKVTAAGVKGFPTMLLHKANGQKVEFSGERTPEGWESWLKSVL